MNKASEKIKSLTLDYVADLLAKKGLMDAEQRKEIFIKGEGQRARLYKAQESFYTSKRLHSLNNTVSPAEVITSFNLQIPGGKGKVLSEDIITEAIADDVKMPYKKIDPLKLNMDVVASNIPRPFAQRHLVVPIEDNEGVVTVAVADPFELEAVESLGHARKLELKLVLSSKTDILRIVREFYGFRSSVMAAQKEHSGGMVDLSNLEQYVKLKGTSDIEATDQHVVNAVEFLLRYAYDQKASDIHIEPKRDHSVVRLRIDGILHNLQTIPKVVHPSVVSRIKMLSRMDVAERRRPQDGRIKADYLDREMEMRVSTLPTAFGEKVVMRIFDPEILFQKLESLGFYKREFGLFDSYLKKTYGIILVTGPTGSGKTTTLYSSLKYLSTPEVNIVTIEDPIEMIMEEFNQVGVQHQIGVDFASSLRTILRQDPDIIMVGEIRDKETANNAVQSALTGHLVLSTLHTNDAPSSISRLLDLGVPAFLISSTVLGIVAQRLLRKICQHCKTQRLLKSEEIAYLQLKKQEYQVSYGEGCTECRGTGYKGRTGIFEIMDISNNIKSLISENCDTAALREAARKEKLTTLRQCGLKKMLEGITTYEEVVSVTS